MKVKVTFISIDLTLGAGDYVGEVTSPDKVGSGPMSAVEPPRGDNIYGSCDFFYFVFFNRATAHTNEPIAQKTRSGVRKTFLGSEKGNSEIWVFYLKNTPIKWVRKGNYQPK